MQAIVEAELFQHFILEVIVVGAVAGTAFGLLFVVIEFTYRRAQKNFGHYWDRTVNSLEGINKSLAELVEKGKNK